MESRERNDANEMSPLYRELLQHQVCVLQHSMSQQTRQFIVQHSKTLPKYGHGVLIIRHP